MKESSRLRGLYAITDSKLLADGRLLPYVEAILSVYNTLGRRDNKYKARIKILVASVGLETFREEVERHFATLRREDLRVPDDEVALVDDEVGVAPFVLDVDDVEARSPAREGDEVAGCHGDPP